MRRGVVGEAHRPKVAQHTYILKKMFNLNPKAYTQGPCGTTLFKALAIVINFFNLEKSELYVELIVCSSSLN